MTRVSPFILAVALLVPAAFAQQNQSQPSSTSSSSTHDPQDEASANRRIHDSIKDLLSSDPVLSGAKVDVKVNDHDITLGGSVESYPQHQRVLQLVSSYGQWRRIVDKIQMK
jgi:osmotically-inducible protein OsmY